MICHYPISPAVFLAGPGTVSSLIVGAFNHTTFIVTWMSPDPSIKNGLIKAYFVIVHLHSSNSTIKSKKFMVDEPFHITEMYNAVITGLGRCGYNEA